MKKSGNGLPVESRRVDQFIKWQTIMHSNNLGVCNF